MRSPRRLFQFIALALLAASLGGCGRAPNAPAVTETVTDSQLAKPAASETGLIGDLVGGLVRLVVRVLNLVGSLGGSLTNGRWTVELPAGAVEGDATVTLAVASATSSECHLEIYPSSKNNFAVPARLTVTCPGVSNSQLSNYVIFWYNPGTRRWVEVEGSQVDLATRMVSAPLQHFSKYKVGSKASW